jgi:hypothetical protein
VSAGGSFRPERRGARRLKGDLRRPLTSVHALPDKVSVFESSKHERASSGGGGTFANLNDVTPSRRFSTLVAACSWTFTTGCLSRDVQIPDAPHGVQPVVARQTEGQASTHNTDVLFVVDDSISMADKQRILQASLSWAAGYALSCTSATGHQATPQQGVCPSGYMATVVLGSVGSVGMITTSLEAGGNCGVQNRSAHLFPRVPDEDVWEKYGNQIVAQLENVGEAGCGYEAPLEAMYRFLVDPEPPLTVTKRSTSAGTATVAEGIDEEVLHSRAAFLHPFSQVVVIILTDEDDCSVRDTGDAWKIGAPSGTVSALSAEADPINLRCWDEQRRFGEDWLFPMERYTRALTAPTVVTRSGASAPNPLLGNDRTPDAISVLAIAGVPWQLITRSAAEDSHLSFLSPNELSTTRTWDKILGDPAHSIAPTDAHLVESAEPRAGLALPGDPPDPIHGHEIVATAPEELQFSCIFPLPDARDCAKEQSCECSTGSASDVVSPLCRQPDDTYGTIQRFAGAKPPPRILEFVKSLGESGHLGSICPGQLDDPSKDGFGYSGALRDFARSFQSAWDLSCFYPPLPLRKDGAPACRLLEFHDAIVDCAALGRSVATGPYVDRLLQQMNRLDRTGSTTCEIPPVPGDPGDPTSPAYICAHEAQPASLPPGYCYIDPEAGLGAAALVDACVPGNQRRVRLLPRTLPVPGSVTALICDYGP